jgi:UDP-N-acetylmuramoyl-L-alanyl-D-glutamate--2,6-diaminopimelate ligase
MQLKALVSNLMPAKLAYQNKIFSIEHHPGGHILEQLDISTIEMDSREVKPGSLFVCLTGFKTDGHHFAEEAVQKGAIAILAEKPLHLSVPVIIVADTHRALAYLAARFYHFPTNHLRLIGVTGTNGKTTVTYMVEKILEDYGHKTGRIGTINLKIGRQLQPMKNTTPESLHLQRAFHDMVRERCSHAVMEVSSHALALGRVRGLNFDVAVFTNLTQDHLDFHHDMEAYKQAKGLLFAQLGSAFDEKGSKYAVLNADDPASQDFARMTAAQVISYGIENEADLKATNIALTDKGASFSVEYQHQQFHFNLPLVGLFNVYNALAAIGVGLIEKIPLEAIRQSLQHMTGVPGRMEIVPIDEEYTVIVDYAHTPDSLANVLQCVRQFTSGRLFCVVGCGGNRDRKKRPLMAKIAAETADFTVFTSDNPRWEDPHVIIKEMESGLIGHELLQTKYKSIVDRKEAITWVLKQAKAGDVIVIAGKGHETYQEIKGERFNFDDRQVTKEAVQAIKSLKGD